VKIWTPRALVASLDAALARGEPVAVITVIDTAGSAPRELGAKMLVYADGSTDGTVGGGTLEARAIQEAIVALATGQPRKVRYNLGYSGPRSIGMFCGGEVEVFVDVMRQPARIVLLGGGHVAERVAQTAQMAGFSHSIVDDRADYANRERFPDAEEVLVANPAEALGRLDVNASTYVIIVTRCHVQDMECLASALTTKAAYIGMIGSVTKVRQVYRRLARRHIDPGSDPRVHAPIGLALGTSEPSHIAISIMAEILKEIHGGTGASLRDNVPVRRRTPPARLPAVDPRPAAVNVACSVPIRSRSKKEAV
jgi:xanthine dehydrogenase accessory factor